MGVLDFIGGLASAGTALWNNERNIQFQQDANTKNEALMREAWAREDTAVQRRAKDLEAAGLNPLLAVGSPASSMGAIRTEAPQARENPAQAGIVAMNAISNLRAKQASIAQTKAQTDLTNKQAQNVDADIRLKLGTVDAKIQQEKASAELATRTLQDKIYQTQAETTRAWNEASASQSYYWSRGSKMYEDYTISHYQKFVAEVAANAAKNYGDNAAAAELARKQSEAIAAAALAGMKELELEQWKAMGIAPSAGQALLDVFLQVLRGGTSLMGGALK